VSGSQRACCGSEFDGPSKQVCPRRAWLLCTRCDSNVLDSDVIAMTAKGQRPGEAAGRWFSSRSALFAARCPDSCHEGQRRTVESAQAFTAPLLASSYEPSSRSILSRWWTCTSAAGWKRCLCPASSRPAQTARTGLALGRLRVSPFLSVDERRCQAILNVAHLRSPTEPPRMSAGCPSPSSYGRRSPQSTALRTRS
jgi:hypothetical protein